VSDAADPVIIRDLESHDDFRACVRLQDETWGASFSERVPPAILKVARQIGGVSAGAFTPDGQLVGFVFGLTGVRDGRLIHWSDMLAVRDRYRGRRLGQRLKEYQRAKVRALGVEAMRWTFDPLSAGNAHFNINVLGATPVEYVPDMYGSNTGSALLGALPSDRFVVEWDIAANEPRGPSSESANLTLANPLDPAGRPVTRLPSDPGLVAVQIPRELADVQRLSPEQALEWRLAVRHAIVPLLAQGRRVAEFRRGSDDHLPRYVFTPPPSGAAR
jgi:predicted GNAT superfamily acetyltransferase